ncbi:ubiquitin carboxyl-terminal hydrolase 42-like isoform X2 [Mercenaria mercenaria]|uniref:ubiquitin carboxyl-terminal hydrolase 42-like isoform X2 n=1 Tax=Mercenaria mercenaria TaxID=6596 RepID=UPI00234E61E7|nr:ubiquitin carboxyl-terminal hydrolase 42-like isoform X2 [Mercenaria mercenaria]
MQNIEQKLESTFGKKADLETRLQSACSGVLTQKIDFQESSKPHSSVSDMLKGKYVNLAPAASSSQKSPTTNNDGEGLPHPKQILFKEPLDFVWRHPASGTGLHNCGNTCFLNATLQILIHTPPLTNYMTSGHHTSICRLSHEKCILCNLQRLTRLSLNAGESLSPKWFTNNLQWIMKDSPMHAYLTDIGRHFRSGRQEDAHEFLRLSLEKMQKCALVGCNNLDKYSKETTVINQIFGGYLRSQVLCCRCGHRSNTYDPLLDISLDIKSVDSIERAFHQFVAAEKLEHENAYKCERCKQKVTAFKRFTIHKPPNVLTIQLKRFQFGSSGSFFGNKILKAVRYPLTLNVRPFMSEKNGPPMTYTLFGSIQHEGMSCSSGHYVANVRCGTRWYHFNDSSRYIRSGQHCVNENSAYILFYIKDNGPTPQIGPSVRAHNGQNTVPGIRAENEKKIKPQTNGFGYSPTIIKTSANNHQQRSGQQPKIATNTNEARNQKLTGQQSHRMNTVPSNEIGKTVKSPFVPLSADRDKVKFNIGEKKMQENHKTPEKSMSEKPKVPERLSETPKMPAPKPVSSSKIMTPVKSEVPVTGRLVVKIADGKSVTYETSPDGERRIISDDDEVVAKMNRRQRKKLKKKHRIVPYGTDSDSDWSSSSSSPNHSAGSSSKTNHKENGHQKTCLVFDGALNTTTSVPGNAHLFSTITMKDKVSHTSPQHVDRPKDLKMFSPKNGHQSSALKRQFSETLSCDTAQTPAKHSGMGEWHTSIESMQSPSIGSNHSHSSVHSSGSTHDWSVLKNKDKLSNGCSERKHDGWTVTPGKKDSAHRTVSEENIRNGSAARLDINSASSPFEDISDRVYLIKPEKSKDENSVEHRKLKKHKKHKKRKHHEREHNYAEVCDDSISRSHKKKKKKKHKHKDRDEDREERKHKKHEREKDEVERQRDRSTDDEERQHKKKDDREIEEGYRQKYREYERDDKHHKRKHGREASEKSHKKSRHDSGSSPEFVWVEKTVPVQGSVSEPVTPSHRWDYHVKDGYKRLSSSGTSTPTISSSWDGLKASKVAQELEKVSSYSYGAPVTGWDGSRSQMDVEKDREYTSHKRKDSDDEYDDEYDTGKVTSYVSKFAKSHQEKVCFWALQIMYTDVNLFVKLQMPIYQVKKVKHKHHSEHRSNGNMFQLKQDQTNRSKINWSSLKIGENNPFNKQPDRPQNHPR